MVVIKMCLTQEHPYSMYSFSLYQHGV